MKKKMLMMCVFAVLFILLMVLVRVADVAAIGPEGTKIGLSGLNRAVHEATGVNMRWYEATELLGYFSIFVAILFALLGLAQWIRRRSLMKVDGEILSLGILFVLVAVLYVFFEKVIINYRPVIMPGDDHVEASFPSTHTMLVCAVMGGIMMIIPRYDKNQTTVTVIRVLCVLVIAAVVVGRLLSGVHWLTDILGGLLLGGALLSLFSVILDRLTEKA